MKKRVLFVCLGNICRSPAAEGIFHALTEKAGVSDNYLVDSAGTYGGHRGDLPDHRMREAASRRSYELAHRSRQVRTDDFDNFDFILAMDDSNYENLYRLAPSVEAGRKIHRIMEFSSRKDYDHIPDPYYEGRDGFELVLDMLEDACAGLLNYTEKD